MQNNTTQPVSNETVKMESASGIAQVKTHSQEHSALSELLPMKKATHIAVRNGNWSDPQTWSNRKIPALGARVFIPHGTTVTYNQNSESALDWVRVEGELRFSTTQTTKLLLDTLGVMSQGELEIGTQADPIRSNQLAQIFFTAKSPINREHDPTLLGRGIISQGRVSIYGADKLDHVALVADAKQGDRELVLDLPKGMKSPKGWQIGDQLVLGGTSFQIGGNNQDNTKFKDEVLTITDINGNRIKFKNNDISSGNANILRFDHLRPRSIANKVDLYVANISRNIRFETLNGKNVPTQQRGHAMFMDNANVNIQNAGFYELGRTDKSKPIDDVGQNIDGSRGTGLNQRGRYGIHIHQTGIAQNDGTVFVKGNAVVGSPGWGIAQHASKTEISDNVVFDVAGAGIVSEDGNEIGVWRNNITIKTTGDGSFPVDPASLSRLQNYDLGFEGEGYWLTGAGQIALIDNIAISAAGGGLNVFSKAFGIEASRPINTIDKVILPKNLQAIAPPGMNKIPIENVPLRELQGFKAYNSTNGIFFWQHMGNNDGQLDFNAPNLGPAHNVRTKVSNFQLWNILDRGLDYEYSTQIDVENGLIVGNPDQKANFGIRTNGPSQDLGFKGLFVEGFKEGLTIPREGPLASSVSILGSSLENSTFQNNDRNFSERLALQIKGREYFTDYFQIRNTKLFGSSKNRAPVAKFTYRSIGGKALLFDASSSFDPSVAASRQNSRLGIVAYGWDWNNDGKSDDFGRVVQHRFQNSGPQKVTLSVWDDQGKTHTSRQIIKVQNPSYPNLWLDSPFDKTTQFTSDAKFQGSTGAGLGWLTSGWKINPNVGQGGVAEVKTDRKGLAQVIYDHHSRIGDQTLSLDIRKINRDNIPSEVLVKLWGINGEFEAGGWRTIDNGPFKVGSLPLSKNLLLSKVVSRDSSEFSNYRWNISLGNEGYDYLAVQVNASGVATPKGDQLQIDNVKLFTPKQNQTASASRPKNRFAQLEMEPAASSIKTEPKKYHSEVQSSPAFPVQTEDRSDRGIAFPLHNRVIGDSKRNKLSGGNGRDILIGQGGGDHIYGNSGNDTLAGQSGSDRIQGGLGNDLIVGGQGADTLSGETGSDRFRWTKPSHGVDTILDFKVSEDYLDIRGNDFDKALKPGLLQEKQLVIGTRSQDISDRFLYDSSSGRLWFDVDGIGKQQSVLLARLSPHLMLKASNFIIQ